MAGLFARVLFATDLSDYSNKLLVGIGEMRPHGLGEVMLLHAVGEDEGTDSFFDAGKQAKEELAAYVERLAGLGIRAGFSVKEGEPGDVIAAAAEDWDATLILAGSHGHGFIKGLLVGSVAEDIVEKATRPVLVLRLGKPESHRGVFEKVLIPLDFSDGSIAVFEALKGLGGGVLGHAVLAHVVEGGSGEEERRALVESSESRLGIMAGEMVAAGIRAAVHVHSGHAVKDIEDIAAEEGATLIAVCACKKEGIKEFVLGGTAKRVLVHARVSVLFFP